MNFIGRLKRFVRKHDRLLSVFGALIIFLTFLAGEKFRDELKELVDSIDTARNVFLIRSDSRDIAEQVAHLQESLGKKQPQYALTPSNMLSRSFTESIMSSLDLLNKVPHGEEFDKEAADFAWRRDKWSKEFLRPIAPIPEGPIVHDKVKEAADAAIDKKLWMEASVLDTETFLFGGKVVDMARKVEAEKERQYLISKHVSYYFLYPLGWLLGLIGVVFGREGVRVLE